MTPFFAFPPEIRKVIYTINAVESLNMTLRKVIKNARFVAERRCRVETPVPGADQGGGQMESHVQGWKEALNRFQILWPDRMLALERG